MEQGIIAIVLLLIALELHSGISVKTILDNQREVMTTLNEVLRSVKGGQRWSGNLDPSRFTLHRKVKKGISARQKSPLHGAGERI